MINKISSKMYYQDLYFSDRVETIEIYSVTADTPMQKQSDKDQYPLY